MSNIDNIRQCLEEMRTHVLFDYKGIACGIDPLSKNEIDMWFGKKNYTASSVDNAMAYRLFNGKSITDIADQVQNLEL